MKRRDASQLAALVREKKQLEATAAKYKSGEAKLTALEKIERLMENGDEDEAVMELLRLKHGDKAGERLSHVYNGLTRRVLGVQSDPQLAKVEQRVSRFDEQLEAIKNEKAQIEAKLAERDAADQELRVQGAIKQVEGYLKGFESEYPFLLAEADSPEEVVWGILEEAAQHGQDLTLEQAARLANDHFKPAFEKRAPRYQNLLAQNQAKGSPTKPEAPASTTGAPPRKSLTNADASSVPAEKALEPPKTDAERRDRAFAALQAGRHDP